MFSGAATGDDALGAKKAKLLGDRREADVRGLGELGDAPLAVAEPVEELEPRDVARGAEDRRRALELIVAHRLLAQTPRVLLGPTMVVVARAFGDRRALRLRPRRMAVGRRPRTERLGRVLVFLGDGGTRHHFTV